MLFFADYLLTQASLNSIMNYSRAIRAIYTPKDHYNDLTIYFLHTPSSISKKMKCTGCLKILVVQLLHTTIAMKITLTAFFFCQT